MTEADLRKLERIDEMLWKNILEYISSVPRDLIYLELGLLRVKDIIITSRIMFLHHIMKQEKEALLYHFLIAQVKAPSHNNWVSNILKDLEKNYFQIEFEEVESISKDKFKEMLFVLVF